MSLAQWRQFNFFDKQQVVDPEDATKSPAIFQKPGLTVFAAGRGHVVLADKSGNVYLVDRHFHARSFLAYDGGSVTHLKQLKQKNILVTIGESNTENEPIVKFWDLDSIDKSKDDTVNPKCIHTIKVQHGNKPHPVSTFAVLENMSQIAIGLASGAVILIRGDLTKDRTTKQNVIFEGKEPITGLGFREQTKSTILFMVTTTSIMSYNTTANKNTVVPLDEQGCGLDCTVMSDAQDMVMGRDEAIYFYDTTGRGPCFAYDTPKSSLTWFKSNYLVIVSPTVTTSSHLSSGTRSSFNMSRNTSDMGTLTKIAVFDTANKFLAHVGTVPGGIRSIFCEWNSVWIVGTDGKVYRLDEKDTPTKLEILFKLNLYMLAINLAHMQKYDDASIAEIFRKYGDHLYLKADYDGAMEQYIRTIGQLEPSYVIRKFLDAQRIYNLTNYLQELHSKGLANADHTTLLLNCYTKLKDVSRLDQFIKTDAELNFDLETAISVCRQAGYYEHAVYLAEKFKEHDLYLDITIEDRRNYDAALTYIRTLGPNEADKHLQKYSKTLLGHLPEQTTELLTELCTGTLPVIPTGSDPSLAGSALSPTPSANNTTALSHLPFSVNQHAVDGSDSPDSSTQQESPQDSPVPPRHGPLKNNGFTYVPPSPRTFMPVFVDRPDCLAQFLERVFEKRWQHRRTLTNHSDASSDRSQRQNDPSTSWTRQELEERKAIWNTLLELYLMDEQLQMNGLGNIAKAPSVMSDRERQKRVKEFHSKALALLKDDMVDYDTNQALVLCQLKNFDEGIVYLYEKTGMYTDIIRFWMEKENTDRVIECVRKYGPKDPSLYPMVLTYFSSSPEILSRSTSELLSTLNHIDDKNLLPPLQVVQALSRSNVATIGLLKGYIGKKIEHERQELEENEELITSYREETERQRREIEELQTNARIFQVQRCSHCNSNLDLPAVHFLCRHSFHERCLGEDGSVCPECAVQHDMVAEIRRTQEMEADNHARFFEQLKSKEDGFSVIADYFSKNTMAFAKLID